MFTLPNLPYDPKALEPYIDVETIYLHHDKHHAAYVNNLNELLKDEPMLLGMEISELVKNLDKVPEEIRRKVRNNAGGHLNHSIFWESLISPKDYKQLDEDSLLFKKISEDLGSWSAFQIEFEKEALGLFGSGWVWLVEQEGKLNIVSMPLQDNPLMEGMTPLLGLDLWEHAYYLKYKNVRKDYIAAWWNIINWKKVSENLTKSS